MATSVSSATKFFPKPQEGFTTTTSGSISSGATSVGLTGTGNYTNGDVVVLMIEPGVVGKEQSFTGTIDTGGSQVTGVVWTSGVNTAHAGGVTVVDYVAAAHLQLISTGALVSHDQDGTPKAGITYPASTFTTPTIASMTNAQHNHSNAAGGGQLTGSTALVNSTVTADKLATGAAAATVATSETTSSASYVQLATTTDTVTVTIGANGLALVSIGCGASNTVANNGNYMSFAISGATTQAAADTFSSSNRTAIANFGTYHGRTFLVTGLTPGSTTFGARYRTEANTATIADRKISVVPL